MTTATNNLNGIASGTAVTTANSGSTSGTAFNSVSGSVFAQSTSAFEGASGLAVTLTPAARNANVSWNSTSSNSVRLSTSYYFKFDNAPSSDSVVTLSAGALIVTLDSTSKLNLINAQGGAVSGSTSALTAGTWYFVQSAVTRASSSVAVDGRLEMRVYRVSDGLMMGEVDSGNTLVTGTQSAFTINYGAQINWATPAFTNTVVLSYDLLAYTDGLKTQNFPIAAGNKSTSQDFNALADGTAITTTVPATVTGTTTAEQEDKFDFANTTSGTLTASTTSPGEGTTSAITATASGSGNAYVGWISNSYSGLRGALSFILRIDTLPTTGYLQVLNWGAAGSIRLDSTGTLSYLVGAGSSAVHTSTALSTGVWYRIQSGYWPGSKSTSINDQRVEFRVFDISGTVVDTYDSGFTVTGQTSNPTSVLFGIAQNGTYTGAAQVAVDALHVRSNWPGGYPGALQVVPPPPVDFSGSPALFGSGTLTASTSGAPAAIPNFSATGTLTTSAAVVTSTGKIKVWNGSAWVAKPLKVWNGSAWVTKPVKHWTGSAWVPTSY